MANAHGGSMLPSGMSRRRTLAILVVVGLASVGVRAQSAVTLAPTAAPAAAQPGVHTVVVIGTDFPAGPIQASDIAIRLDPAVQGAGPSVSTVARAVALVFARTRRVAFTVPAELVLSTPTPYLVSLSGRTASGQAFASQSTSALTVNPPASILSLTPSTVVPGTAVPVAIAALHTDFLQGATQANFGPGISVGGGPEGGYGPVSVTSPVTATALLTVSGAAAAGLRPITVATGVQEARVLQGFTVGAVGDRSPPLVTLTGPTSALPGSRIVVTATASDNIGVASLRFEVSGQPPSTLPAPPYQRTIDVPPVAAPGDTIQVRAIATDLGSNTGQADHVVTIVAIPDTENPTVALSVPPEISPGSTLRMTATAHDNVGVARVVFSVNGTPITTDDTAPYEASFAVPADAPVGGSLTVVARAVDFSDNAADSQGFVAIVATADAVIPTVALTAPAEILAGQALPVSATVSDNVGIASVALFVDGARLRTFTAPPYDASYVVPRTMSPGTVLHLTAVAADFSSNEGRAAAETQVAAPSVAGTGLVTGDVYDDRTGLPIEGVTVAIAGTDATGAPYERSAVTDRRGRYSLAVGAGRGLVGVSKAGWTCVQRPVDVTAGQVVDLIDARLTALAPLSAPIAPVIGGKAGAADAELTVPPGGLAAEAALGVTSIGQQGLQGLLPPGWSPVGMADVIPLGVTFQAATLRVRNAFRIASGTALVLAEWDETAGAWRAVGPSVVPDDAQALSGDVPRSGQFAWLLADSVPAPPPVPAPGEIVRGVSMPVVPDTVTTTITPQPKIAIYRAGVVSEVRGALTGAAPLSSGTLVWTRISETYRFRSGGEASPEPFIEDLILFQTTANGSSVSASYPVTPSLAFDATSLDRGIITVELIAPPVLPDLPAAVGPHGMTVVAAGDRLLQVPAGALGEPTAVAVRGLAPASLGMTLPAGLEFIEGVEVSFLGTLGQPAVLSIPLPAGMTDASRVLVVRLEQIGTDTKLVLVGTAAVAGTRLVSQTAVGGDASALEGIRTGGRYLLVRAAQPFGFAVGQVLGVGGGPFAGAVVSSGALPITALSSESGRYGLAVAVGSVALTALDVARSDTGSGNGTLANPGEALTLDLRLVAQVPRVISVAPVSGAASVPLANPVVVTFSEPIDPTTITGTSAQNVSLSSAAGAVVGTVALSNNNTVVTFRPIDPLLPNISYTVTVAAVVQDRSGYAMAAAFVSEFSSLDTLPPLTPPAGNIQAAVPDAGGITRVTATQGTAGPHDTVTVVNTRTKAVTPVLLDPDGGFTVQVPVGLADALQIRIVDPAGNQTVADIPAFTQTNPDGSVSKVIGPDGGRIEGDHGVAVDVAAGTFPSGAVVTVKAVLPEDFPVALPADAQQHFRLDGGVKLDFGGAEPTRYVNVSLPAVGDEKADDQWVVSRVADLNGQQVLDVTDSGKLLGGRITTSSPPCPGVTKQGTYGLYRSNEILGWNYTYLSSTNGNTVLEARNDLKALLTWITMPYLAIEPPAMRPVCYPVISGRVTVVPNSVKVTIPGSALTPADREIVIRNQRTGTEQHYPRNAAEFVFEMSGSDRDGFSVKVNGPAGEQQVRAIGVTSAVTGTVVIRFSPDVVTVPVEQVIVRNLKTAAERVTYVTTEDLTLAADSGEADSREVTARAVAAGVRPRSLTFSVAPSPYGPGNLVLRALEGTFDPRPPRGVVDLNGMEVPESAIVNGGIAWAFDGSFSDRYILTVAYPGSNSVVVKIPSFQIVVTNPQTGKIIKTIVGQSPPRDQPLSLGVISDDFASPFVIAGPSRINSFDPAGLISFTFSEPMNADSVKSNLFVEDDQHAFVQGEVRISAGNRVATFVPLRPLKLGATYAVTLKGNDELGQLLVPNRTLVGVQGMTDPSGNRLPTTRLTIKVFAPRRAGGLATAAPVNDVVFEHKRVNNAFKTFVFAATNSGAEDKVVGIDMSDVANPAKVGGNGDQAPARKRIALVPGVSVGGLSNGDLAVTASFNLYYSFLNYYDVTNPANIRWLANKLLTATPDFLTPFNNRGTYHIQGFARGVAALKTPTGVYAYSAVQGVGVMAADVARGIPEPGSTTRYTEPMFPGDFVDVAAVNDKLLAVRRVENQLYMFDANLSPLMQFDLPDIPRRVVTVSGFPIDDNADGIIGQNEIYDLAFIACEQSILIIDLADMLGGQAAGLPIIGTIPRTAITRELDVDGSRQRLFAGGDDGLLIIDISRPRDSANGNDLDGDGVDDRIIWTNPRPRDVGGLKIDADRGVLYVGHGGGVDVWAVYENCCDLGVDMTAEPKENLVADRKQLLLNEKQALQLAIGKGLAEAAAGCGIDMSTISMLEQGSGACLWKGDPNKTCSENYQPGISDHDFEVFLPSAQVGSAGSCVTKKLNDQFRDPDTGEPKPVALPNGSTMVFDDISFFPMSKDDFERAKLNVMPPVDPVGSDPTGDLGLGRQGLLLKWVLEGAYVEVPGRPMSGAPLESILDTLKTTTGIAPLEGYEWAMLQDFALAKSKARIRIAGASETDSSFYKLYIKQLHDAGKAGIRTALGWMVSDEQANRIVLDITRERYEASGCLAIERQLTDPNAWLEKPCRSFEEYVASAAARTLRGYVPLPLFTRSVVVDQINRFFRVKSDLEPMPSEADANEFVASVATFIANAKTATEPIFSSTVGQDPDGPQRTRNIDTARQKTEKALREAHLQPVAHFYNRGFVMGRQLRVAMYRDAQLVKEFWQDLAGGENLYPKYERNPDGSLKLDQDHHPIPLFDVGPLDQTTDLGQAKPVAFTIDLPDKTMREANRQNNVGGFYYYTLNLNSPAPPSTPSQPPSPIQTPGLLDPDPECEEGPTLKITQDIVAGSQVLNHDAVLGLGEEVTLRIKVENTSGSDQSDVVVCSTLTNVCESVGSLAVGATATKEITFKVPNNGIIADVIATAYGPTSGVLTSAPLRVMASCEAYQVIPPDRDPNPKADESKIMVGGTAFRYLRVVNRRTGDPIANAAVEVEARSASRSLLYRFTTDQHGMIVKPNEKGMAFPFVLEDDIGQQFALSVLSVNGISPTCTVPPGLDVTVTDREFNRNYGLGAGISSDLSFIASIKGSLETGLKLARKETVPTPSNDDYFDLARSFKVGVSLGLDVVKLGKSAYQAIADPPEPPDAPATGAPGSPQASKFEASGEAATTLSKAQSWRTSYRFSAPLDQSKNCAISEVMLQGLIGVSPVFNRLLNVFRTHPCPGDRSKYLTSAAYDSTQSFNATGGVKVKSNHAARPLGIDITGSVSPLSVSSSLTTGLARGYSPFPTWNSIKESYKLSGGIDFTAGLTTSQSAPPAVQEDEATSAGLFWRTLAGSFSGSTADSYAIDFQRVPGEDMPNRISVTYSGPKGFGWKFSSIYGVVAAGTGNQPTLTWTIDRPEDIQKAVDALANYKAIKESLNVGGVMAKLWLVPTVLNDEVRKFFEEVLPATRTSFEQREEFGGNYDHPIAGPDVKIGKLFSVKIGLTIKANASIGHLLERGVNVKGRSYTLERYTRDRFIPNDQNLLWADAIKNLSDLVDSFTDTFSEHTVYVDTARPDIVLRSTGSATLHIDGTKEPGPFDATVFSYHYDTTPGPVTDGRQLPASTSGPVGEPHYGIGGFHHFGPLERRLGAPSQLVIDYTDDDVAGFDESGLAIYAYDEDTNDWDYVGGTVDAAANTVTVMIDTMKLYTIGAAMPKGDIVLTGVQGEFVDDTVTFTVTSDTVLLNNGQPVPDGTLFSVRNMFAGGTPAEIYGALLVTDADPQLDNIQVTSSGGRISFQIRYPAPHNNFVPGRLAVYSPMGTAYGDVVLRQQ